MSPNNYTSWLQAELARLLEQPPQAISPTTPLLELGVDSIVAVRLSGVVSEALGVEIEPMLLFDYPTLEKLAAHLHTQYGDLALPPQTTPAPLTS